MSELPIKSIDGNAIQDINGNIKYVFEVFPLDFLQMEEFEGLGYLEQIKNFLLTTTNNYMLNDLNTTLKDRLKESSKRVSFKCYKLDDRFFIECPFEIDFLGAKNATNYFDYFLAGHDDFYGDVNFGLDSFKINGIYYRLVNVYDFADSHYPFQLSELGDQLITFSRIPSETAIKMLDNSRKLHVGNIGKLISDESSENAFKQSEHLVKELTSGLEGIFESEMWFILKSESESRLNYLTNELFSNLKKLKITPLIETKNSFAKLVPTLFFGVNSEFLRCHPITSTYLCNVLPLHREHIYEDGIEFQTRSGNKVFFDNFYHAAENGNMGISGTTGSGKSVLGQKILDYSRLKNRSVVIIDLGESFLKYCEYYGGNIFSEKINPMGFRDPEFLNEFVLSFIPESEISTKEKGKLFELINNALLADVLTFQELVTYLDKELKEISYYFSKVWPYISNDSFEKSKITYFDLSLYPKDMIPGVILFAIKYLKDLGDSSDLRTLLIDECWSFLKRNADYIEECFRTFRKHGCAAIAITQNIEDFLTLGKISTAILGCCNFQIYFRQDITTNSKEFINPFTQELITNLNSEKNKFSEFLVVIKNAKIKKVCRYYASSLELGIYNSSHNEKTKWKQFKEKFLPFFTYQEVMNSYVVLNNGGQP
ncbi:MAG: hypothetical protein H7281_15130 [Bacteriovorax sp.]|nr:hypothetical protein [Bacteriovorax sp.]